MGTTTGGLPYPEPTDPVTEGAAAIQALAEKLDLFGTYVPTVAGLTIGNGTITGRWWATARLLMAEAVVTWGSSTTSSNPISLNPPVAVAPPAVPLQSVIGNWTAWHPTVSPALRSGWMVRNSATNTACRNAEGTGIGGSTNPFAWTAGCTLIATFAYPLLAVPGLLRDALEDATGAEAFPELTR